MASRKTPEPPLMPRPSWTRDQRGGVAVYVALIAAVTFGIVGLAIDATRAMIVRSESQAAADAAALAAASQLDGTPSAITRANAAIANFVTNAQRMASTGPGSVAIAQVRYLSGLPADDASPIDDDLVTTNPLEARFVEVTTAPLTHLNTFLRAVSADEGVTITTQAVAGCNQIVCRTPPLMMCNPAEDAGSGEAFNIDNWRGRQVILMHQGGMNATWAPGNFGFLEVSAPGADALRDALASVNGANDCYGPAVTTEPGAKNGTRTALNVRFGMYENPGFGGGAKNSAEFAPDENVRVMPRDLEFSGPSDRFGNGEWNCDAYWALHFAGSSTVQPAGCTSTASSFTRYDMYQFEIANGLAQAPPENAANALADRRTLYIAVVNCVAEGLAGKDTVTAVYFVKLFLTEPVGEPSGVEIIGEIVDIVEVGVDDTVLHDIVQLYR